MSWGWASGKQSDYNKLNNSEDRYFQGSVYHIWVIFAIKNSQKLFLYNKFLYSTSVYEKVHIHAQVKASKW